jgi:plasmid replication initiation protein
VQHESRGDKLSNWLPGAERPADNAALLGESRAAIDTVRRTWHLAASMIRVHRPKIYNRRGHLREDRLTMNPVYIPAKLRSGP